MGKIYETVKGIGRKYVAPAVLGGVLALGGCREKDNYEPPISQETKNYIAGNKKVYVESKQSHVENKKKEVVERKRAEEVFRDSEEILEKKVKEYQENLGVSRRLLNKHILVGKVIEYQSSLEVARESFNDGIRDLSYCIEEQELTHGKLEEAKEKYNKARSFAKEKGLDSDDLSSTFPDEELYDNIGGNLSGWSPNGLRNSFRGTDLEGKIKVQSSGKMPVDTLIRVSILPILLGGWFVSLLLKGRRMNKELERTGRLWLEDGWDRANK